MRMHVKQVIMNKLDRCLNLELRKANRVLSQIYDSYMAKCGLKTSQFSILRAVSFLKNCSGTLNLAI
jgi:hypothetical protein